VSLFDTWWVSDRHLMGIKERHERDREAVRRANLDAARDPANRDVLKALGDEQLAGGVGKRPSHRFAVALVARLDTHQVRIRNPPGGDEVSKLHLCSSCERCSQL